MGLQKENRREVISVFLKGIPGSGVCSLFIPINDGTVLKEGKHPRHRRIWRRQFVSHEINADRATLYFNAH